MYQVLITDYWCLTGLRIATASFPRNGGEIKEGARHRSYCPKKSCEFFEVFYFFRNTPLFSSEVLRAPSEGLLNISSGMTALVDSYFVLQPFTKTLRKHLFIIFLRSFAVFQKLSPSFQPSIVTFLFNHYGALVLSRFRPPFTHSCLQ